ACRRTQVRHMHRTGRLMTAQCPGPDRPARSTPRSRWSCPPARDGDQPDDRRSMGITIPQGLLLRAVKVIR
ncbi:MAG: hypothetical protein ABW034_20630, partial [Steroidobacteraceae bacterium]